MGGGECEFKVELTAKVAEESNAEVAKGDALNFALFAVNFVLSAVKEKQVL